ncbi:MAG: PQQ-binding-like beta-propeller repeat protein [Myxococcales bacterium]|jgi:hypothetical protein
MLSMHSSRATASRTTTLTALLLVLGSIAGCAGTPPAFSTKYPDNVETDIEVLLQRIDAAPRREPGTVAVGITSAPTRLYGFDIANRQKLWEQPVPATTEPMLAGDAVVVGTEGAVLGFDLRTGARRFSVSTGGKALRGADGETGLVAIALGEGMGTYARSEIVLVRGATVAWRRDIPGLVGVPAVIGGMVLVPWANQYLTALDDRTGNEIARVRTRDGVIAHALADRGNVYIGSHHGITRITSSIGSGTLRGAGFFSLPDQDLPGRPLLLRDIYTQEAAYTAESARHRIQLAWQPTTLGGARIGLQDDTLFLVYYRFVYGLSPEDLSIRWVHVHDQDIVGATARPGGLLVGDAAGNVSVLSAHSGDVVWQAATNMPSAAIKLPRGGADVAPGQPPGDTELLAQLMRAAQDTDARLVPGRVLAVDAINRMPDAEATANLIVLCDDDQLAPPVNQRACSALKNRSKGKEHLLAALQRHAGYLEGTTAPPVGALARAAATQNEVRAVPLLITHLQDPATRSRALPGLVEGLGGLGDERAFDPLRHFFALYHADPVDEHVVRALEIAPEVLVELGGEEARPVLEQVRDDGLGIYPVRDKARLALVTLDERAKAAAAAEAREGEPETPEQPDLPEVDPRSLMPTHLTTDLVNQTLLPVRDKLVDCLRNAEERIYQARVVLVIEDGKVLMVSVLPKELQTCVEPIVRAQTFPRTRAIKRERLTYTLKWQ